VGSEGTSGGVLVLIAEDEPAIAAVLAAVVEDLGYTSVRARHGREALTLARERRPVLLITDLMMPELDGAALITALRAEHGASLPVILVTASPLALAHAVGADAILPKPFDVDALEVLLTRLLPP
jgi:CheY-like chemotaxis protein